MAPIRATLTVACLATPLAAQQWQSFDLIAGRSYPAIAYDVGNTQIVLFGGRATTGVSDQTWLHDGSDWRLATPANRPPPREQAALAHDFLRGRTILFGGFSGTLLGDTWEWDGSNWQQIPTAHAPSPRAQSALAFDVARSRIVLFGGLSGPTQFNDTWTYDGTDWTPIATQHAPWTQRNLAMAYDLLRDRTVMLSGFAPLSRIWEFDGVDWTQITTPATPPWRESHGMTYDVARNRTVVFGGIGLGWNRLNDTWEYDGATWTQRTPANPPAPQDYARLAYDLARQRTVMFAGTTAAHQASTWSWNGTDWSDHAQPAARTVPAFAGDTLRGRTVMYGGSLDNVLQDTWEHDGARWTRIATANGPLPLAGTTLAFDSGRARTILFGGLSSPFVAEGGTWEYDGVSWTVRQLAVRPPARLCHAMAFDRARRRVVLFGGETPNSPNAYFDDTWEYDGNGWLSVAPATASPAARTRTAMVFEASRARVLLFGGTDNLFGPCFADTWAWNGVAWLQLAPNGVPPARYGHGLSHDALRGRTLLFGGAVDPGQRLGDTWEFDGDDWTPVAASPSPAAHACALVFQQHTGRTLSFGGDFGPSPGIGGTTYFTPAATPTFTRYGRGCAGSAGVPVLETVAPALPALGTSFPLRLSSLPAAPGVAALVFGFDLVRWNGQALPVDLGAFGLPGCDVWIAPAPGFSVLVPYAGTATYSLALPASPVLTGLVLGTQAVVIDAAAPSGLGSVTNAAILRMY